MGYNENLADRVREFIELSQDKVEEIKMFGGVCFMVNGKMCAGIQRERLMVRLNPDIIEEVVEKEGCVQMDMKGKVMKGYVLVEETALTTKRKLEYWLILALEYNPLAKAAKKKKE